MTGWCFVLPFSHNATPHLIQIDQSELLAHLAYQLITLKKDNHLSFDGAQSFETRILLLPPSLKRSPKIFV